MRRSEEAGSFFLREEALRGLAVSGGLQNPVTNAHGKQAGHSAGRGCWSCEGRPLDSFYPGDRLTSWRPYSLGKPSSWALEVTHSAGKDGSRAWKSVPSGSFKCVCLVTVYTALSSSCHPCSCVTLCGRCTVPSGPHAVA